MSDNSEHFEELGDKYLSDDPMRAFGYYMKALLQAARTRSVAEDGGIRA
jgi:hypothetical protein